MTPAAVRRGKIAALQQARGERLLICYVTSTRPGLERRIADDMLPHLYEHLERGKKTAKNGVDLLIHSNGGSGIAPWRITNLIREYTTSLSVLVPNHAYSAGTLIALGADEIVMHKMACLGPIDPSVANEFNPQHPLQPGQLAQISVEDVSAYFKLVKDTVGINHEDELIQALIAITDKVHPLALGNVQRSHNQSRLIAKKLLKKHMAGEQDHEINQLIDNLKSNLFYHGHAINRYEAKHDLKLKIAASNETLEDLMWSLYTDYAQAMKFQEPFNPLHELGKSAQTGAAPPPPTLADITQQIIAMSNQGIPLGTLTMAQHVELAAALLAHLSKSVVATANKVLLKSLPGVYVESATGTDVYLTDMTIERATVATPAGPQDAFKQEVIWQRWETES